MTGIEVVDRVGSATKVGVPFAVRSRELPDESTVSDPDSNL